MSDKTTINDLLVQDDVNECLDKLQELKLHIKHLIVIYRDDGDELSWMFGGSPNVSAVNYDLDVVKHHVMFEEED